MASNYFSFPTASLPRTTPAQQYAFNRAQQAFLDKVDSGTLYAPKGVNAFPRYGNTPSFAGPGASQFTEAASYPSGTGAPGRMVVGPDGRVIPMADNSLADLNGANRYQAMSVVKNPQLNAAVNGLYDTFSKTANQSLEDFSSYLNNFKTDLSGARSASMRAQDIAPTVSSLTGALGRYTTGLDASNAAYRNALDAGAAAERGVVSRAYGFLPQYDTAYTNARDVAQAQVLKGAKGSMLASGLPMGSDLAATLARESYAASQPYELAKVNKRYDIATGMELPTENAITGRNIAYAGSYLPAIASSRYGAETGTAQAIQSLYNQVRSMSYEDAINFMRAANVPANVQQSILSGNIQALSGIGQLDEAANYRGLQDKLGVNVSQPLYFSNNLPSFPVTSPRYPTTNPVYNSGFMGNGVADAGTGLIDPNTGGYRYRALPGAPGGGTPMVSTTGQTVRGPINVGPGRYPTSSRYQAIPGTDEYIDMATGQRMRMGTPASYYTNVNPTVPTGAPITSSWDGMMPGDEALPYSVIPQYAAGSNATYPIY